MTTQQFTKQRIARVAVQLKAGGKRYIDQDYVIGEKSDPAEITTKFSGKAGCWSVSDAEEIAAYVHEQCWFSTAQPEPFIAWLDSNGGVIQTPSEKQLNSWLKQPTCLTPDGRIVPIVHPDSWVMQKEVLTEDEIQSIVRGWMTIHLDDYLDSCNEVNLTGLAEAAAYEFDHDEWLDNPDHWVWDIPVHLEQELDN